MFVEDLPTYRVKMGRSEDKMAVQISEKFNALTLSKTDLAFLGKDIMSELEHETIKRRYHRLASDSQTNG